MSQLLISKYLNELKKLRELSGTYRESVVREAFKDLLKGWGKAQDLTFIPEYEVESKTKERRYVDGALLHTLRVPFGYWEAKDEKDDLDAEIEAKFKRGYPKTNIVFEDSRSAVLIQHGEEVMRCAVDDVEQLEKLLKLFFGYERPEIEAFRNAVEQFKTDLPAVLEALREMLDAAYASNPGFRKAAEVFLKHAQQAINPSLVEADVREMLIQHVLTGEIFSAVFPGNPFHEDNNIAVALHKLEATFFTGNTKFQLLKGLEPYYAAIRKAASEISTHHEKQAFLKSIYENFYKVYNPKAADRLGVVYTPNEIVRFMIESADWLCQQHFGRSLIDKDVDILDPATGTGTFVCELIQHFAGQPAKLKHKYQKELHANEVAILPYYVANLNIEATYAAATGSYEEFPGLCFVDTLDNVSALRKHRGHMDDMFGAVSDENIGRIKRQNSKTISVIIGNPPYNANQLNENENNKNRKYPEIDKRIKETYIKESTAQKTKLYDMYARFVRWASDRLDENAILIFVSNNSFVEARTFDGFRRCVAREFNEIRIVDLKGNARTSGERRRKEGGNVFEDQIRVGIAVWFCVRKKGSKGCRIYYEAAADYLESEAKRDFLSATPIGARPFEEVHPDGKNNWINLAENDFDDLIPLVDSGPKSKAVFQMRTNGVNTARDEWVYALDDKTLLAKATEAVSLFNHDVKKVASAPKFDRKILTNKLKWSESLINKVQRTTAVKASATAIREMEYRPFVRLRYYADPIFSDRLTGFHRSIFGPSLNFRTRCIAVSAPGPAKHFYTLAVSNLADWHFLGDTQLYSETTTVDGISVANIGDWCLERFRKHYKSKSKPITKDAIFHYVYGVLHNPAYREKYVLNLKREFPRIPFYADFWQWSDWGKALMDLHIAYESVAPFALKCSDVTDEKARKAGYAPKAMLKADREAGRILLDSETTLSGVPAAAWDYRLGNRSALEWVLDQYKEETPEDPTIREKFNTYRFADYKDKVIDLLRRVTTVSVETQKIVEAMRGLPTDTE